MNSSQKYLDFNLGRIHRCLVNTKKNYRPFVNSPVGNKGLYIRPKWFLKLTLRHVFWDWEKVSKTFYKKGILYILRGCLLKLAFVPKCEKNGPSERSNFFWIGHTGYHVKNENFILVVWKCKFTLVPKCSQRKLERKNGTCQVFGFKMGF